MFQNPIENFPIVKYETNGNTYCSAVKKGCPAPEMGGSSHRENNYSEKTFNISIQRAPMTSNELWAATFTFLVATSQHFDTAAHWKHNFKTCGPFLAQYNALNRYAIYVHIAC